MNMNWIAFLAICLIQAHMAFADDTCQNRTTCGACAALDGCGWCAPTQQCLPGSINGPENATCVGSAWEFKACINCGGILDCRECLTRDADCVWCQNSQTCNGIGFVGCSVGHTCPCDIYGVCSDCVNDATCQWCPSSGTCIVNTPDIVCAGGAANYTTGCACNENKDCPTCRNNIGCHWCADGTCSSECQGPIAFSCSLWCSSTAATCGDCVGLTGCGWCKDAVACLDPATSTCLLSHTCPTCNTKTFCDTCLQDPLCVWCGKTSTCELAETASCLMAHTCESYCNGVTQCDACSELPGCVWCDDNKVCADSSTATCFFTHSCSPAGPTNEPNCGFNGGAFVGGMFLVIVLVALLGAAFAFYKWRSGARISYTELK